MTTHTKKGTAHSVRFFSAFLSALLVLQCFGVGFAYAAVPESGVTPVVASEPEDDAVAPASEPEDDTAASATAEVDERDVTERWNAGSLIIDKAGTYYLSANVQTNGTLYLNAPVGENITFDFNGHTAVVAGVVTAGIDVSASKGSVVVTDTSYAGGGVVNRLTVEALKAQDAVAAILWNATEDTRGTSPCLEVKDVGVTLNINTVDATIATRTHDAYGLYLGYAYETEQKALDATIRNSAFTVRVNNLELTQERAAELLNTYGEKPLTKEDSGIAAAIFTRVAGVKLVGAIASEAVSAGGTCDLYSTVPVAFTLGNGFTPSNSFAVYSAANEEYAYFALWGAGVAATDKVLALFTDASANGFVSASDEQGLYFVAPQTNDEVVVGEDTVGNDEATEDEEQLEALLGTMFAPLAEFAPLDNTYDLEWTTAKSILTTSYDYGDDDSVTLEVKKDLDVTGALTINAAGKNITINLNGHTITLTTNSSPTGLIIISNAASVTINGGGGSLIAAGPASNNVSYANSGIYSATETALTVHDLNISVKHPVAATASARKYGIFFNGTLSSLILENCTIDVDLSNATVARTSVSASLAPCGVYLGANVASASINDCTVTTTAETSLFTGATGTNGTKNESLKAYGLYSAVVASGRSIEVKGGTFTVKAPNGSGSAIYAGVLALKNSASTAAPVSLNVSGVGRSAFGIEASTADSLVLSTSPTMVYGQNSVTSAALRTTVEKAFVIDSAFSASSPLSVFFGSDDETANSDGNYFAGYTTTVDSTRQAALKGMFTNALTVNGNASIVDADEEGLFFKYDATKAPVAIVHVGGDTPDTPYASFAAALDVLQPGETIRLFKSAIYGIAIPDTKGMEEESYTIDLNGTDVPFISSASPADFSVINSVRASDPSTINGKIPLAAGLGSSVLLTSAGSLSISDIDISPPSTSAAFASATYGVVHNSGTGTLSLDNVNLTASTTEATGLTGVYAAGASSKINISGGSIVVSKTTTGAALLRGAWAAGAGSLIALTGDCMVRVATPSNIATNGIGIVYGLTATNATSSIVAEADDGSFIECYGSQVYALYGGANGAHIAIKDYKVRALLNEVSSATGRYAYGFASALYNLSATGSLFTATLGLDGTCSFNAPFTLGASLQLGSDFALVQDFYFDDTDVDTTVIGLYSRAPLTNNVFANAKEDDGGFTDSGITSYAGYFKSAPTVGTMSLGTNVYADYGVSYDNGDNTRLIFTTDPVAKNVSTNVEYYLLSTAVAEVEDGETIELVRDVTLSSPLATNKPFTLDLAGNILSINAGTEARVATLGTGGALIFTGDGTLILTDSGDNKGALAITVGGDGDGTFAYKGIVTRGGGTLAIEGVAVSVGYVGSSSKNDAIITLYGIYNQDGIVALDGNTELTVNASKTPDAFGALNAYGIYLDGETGDSNTRVSVGNAATITVTNAAISLAGGYIYNSKTSTDNGFVQGLDIAFKRVDLPANSALYKEIVTKFKQAALFDDTNGRNVYCATPLVLDDGTNLYAFSNPLPQGKTPGDPNDIVPTYIFMQTLYTTPTAAYGIGASPAATGNVSVDGDAVISAISRNGNATAIDATGGGVWTIGDVTLKAQGGDTSYRQVVGVFDLRDFGIGVDEEQVIDYSSIGSSGRPVPKLVKDVAKPRAAGISVVSPSALLVLDGALAVTTEALDTLDIVASTPFKIGSSFDSDTKLTVAGANGINTAGTVFAQPATSSAITETHRVLFKDPAGELSPGIDGADQLKWDELYTVTFKDGDTTVQVDSGYLFADNLLLPDAAALKRDPTAFYTYVFLGWSTDKDTNLETFDETRGDIPASSKMVTVKGTATYYAIFVAIPNEATVTFTGMKDNQGASLPDKVLTVYFDKTLNEMQTLLPAQGVAPVPANYSIGGSTYRFVGWRVAVGGVMYVWDRDVINSNLVFNHKTLSFSGSGNATATAVYVEVNAGQHLITFKENNYIAAFAVDDGVVPVFQNTITNAYIPVIASTVDYTYAFKGWYVGWQDNPFLALNYLTTLPPATADATYTALFARTLREYNVILYYYVRGSSTWSLTTHLQTGGTGGAYVGTGDFTVPYAANPFASTVFTSHNRPAPQDFTQDGTAYTFLGWSIRKSDTVPLIDKDGNYQLTDVQTEAFADSAATYYAIYGKAPHTVTVTFKDGDDVFATAVNIAVGENTPGTIFAALDLDEPTRSGKVFKGWSTEADGALVAIIDLTDDTEFYAVFASPNQRHVNFWDEDQTTLIKGIDLVERMTVASSPDAPTTPGKGGHYFTGWVDRWGDPFDITGEQITSDLDLYATYAPIAKAIASSTGASVDLSTTYLRLAGIETATNVRFELTLADAADGDIRLKAQEDGTTILNAYKGILGYALGGSSGPLSGTATDLLSALAGSEVIVARDFGTVKLTVPVSDTSASKARVYYLKADGSVGVSSELAVSNGTVTFTLSELGLMSNARGNLVVAVVKAPAETPEDPTDDPEDPATDDPAATDTPTTNTGSGLTGSSGTTGSGLTGSTGSGLTGSSGTTGSGLTGADDDTTDTDLTGANGSSGLKSVDDNKTPLASDGDADALAEAAAATGGIGQWLRNNLTLAIIAGVVVLLALAAAAWLLVRRHRHRLINAKSGDTPDEPDASGGSGTAVEEWLSMA